MSNIRIRRVILAAVILPFILLAISCAGSRQQKTIESTFHALNAAKDGFLIWDNSHQQSIVNRATSFEEGRIKIFVYREKREAIISAFEVAYRAIALAALDKSETNVDEALKRAKDVFDAIRILAESE
jgi:hypothetical protein